MAKRLFRLFTELTSCKSVSRITGKFAKSGASRRLIPWFVRTYGISVEEAEKAVAEYGSLNEFFTRRLKAGARPIDPADNALVSPVDALIMDMGTVQEGTILGIKGQRYTIEELLNRCPRAVNYRNGFYIVLYLSPADYHRIHSPVQGKVLESEHVKGKVYPVREKSLTYVRQVLSRNERLITYIRHPYGELAVVKVGALNVSSIQYTGQMPRELERGEEFAYFEFGSTVILLMENGTFQAKTGLAAGTKVRMGERLGMLHRKSSG